jgi:hypothetical protein
MPQLALGITSAITKVATITDDFNSTFAKNIGNLQVPSVADLVTNNIQGQDRK